MKKLLVIIPENFISATGWTLLHSVWQFTAILLIISILRYIYKKNSVVKYWLGIVALGLQFIASIVTFALIFEPNRALENEVLNNNISPKISDTVFLISNNLSPKVATTWWQDIQFVLTEHLDWFVNAWLLGIIFFSIRLIGGYFYTQNMKWKQTKFVDENLQKTFDTLLEKIKLSKPVFLLESSLAKVPMTIGHLESVILLPVGLATGLTTKELEAILAHELAHIKRHDYLINVLQSLIEILFFFHPATWWISTKINEDRENCCDDLAIELTNDKIALAKALTYVEGYKQQLISKDSSATEPYFAMTFGAKRQSFMDRIKRIIGINDSKSNSYSNWVVAAVMIILVAVGGVYSQKNEQSANTPVEIIKSKEGKFEVFATQISANSSNPKQVFAVKNAAGQVYRKSWEGNLNEAEEKLFDEYLESIKANKEVPVAKFSTEIEVEVYTKRMLAHEPYIPISDSLALENAEKEMKRLHDEMQKYSTEMQKYSEILQQKYSKDLDKQSNEMQEISKQMREPQKKMKDLSIDMQEIALAIQKLENKYDDKKMPADAQKKLSELQQREKDVQDKMQKYEAEMQNIEQKMELVEQKMERVQQPMDSVSRLMERYSQPMDSIGKLMDKQGAEIERLAKIEEEKFNTEIGNFSEYLYKEGLIKNKKNYEIRVKDNKMLIDLVPQPANVYDKVWSVIKQKWGKKMNLNSKDLEIRVNGKNNSFNVHSADGNNFRSGFAPRPAAPPTPPATFSNYAMPPTPALEDPMKSIGKLNFSAPKATPVPPLPKKSPKAKPDLVAPPAPAVSPKPPKVGAIKTKNSSESASNNMTKDEVFYENPLVLSGETLNLENLCRSTQGMFSVVKNNPMSKENEAVPFRVYLKRNGKIIKDFPNESPYQIEISRVLSMSNGGDQLLVVPLEKKNWKAKRVLIIKDFPKSPSEKILFDYFRRDREKGC